MTHDVFVPVEDANLVVKVFHAGEGSEPEREWDALVALVGSGVAPEPVLFDAEEPGVVVMSRVLGSPLPVDALDDERARDIGEVHRRVHRAVPSSRRSISMSGVLAARDALMRIEPGDASIQRNLVSDIVSAAWSAARTWIAHADLQHLLSSDGILFSRGDPNLSNYLWTDDGVVLIDFEDSGFTDPVLELADMAEHASTRGLHEDFWIALADATDLTKTDRARVPAARRLMTCFWLVTIEQRQRQGRPTTVTLKEQAHRTLTVLNR